MIDILKNPFVIIGDIPEPYFCDREAETQKIIRTVTNEGNIVLMSMTKNKTCPPSRRTGFYSLNYEDGIDYLKDLIDVAIRLDIIKKSGAWFDIVDADTGEIIQGRIHGQTAVREFLEENENALMKVEKFVDDFIKKD